MRVFEIANSMAVNNRTFRQMLTTLQKAFADVPDKMGHLRPMGHMGLVINADVP